MRSWILAAGLALLGGAAEAQTVAVSGLAGQSIELSSADISGLPHERVTLKLDAKTETCEGAPLSLILAKVGAPQGKALKGPEMADVVVIGAADGYHAALALAETDTLMRQDKVVLADRCEGAPLASGEGPYRLVVEGDQRPARAVRQVVSIAVRRAQTAP